MRSDVTQRNCGGRSFAGDWLGVQSRHLVDRIEDESIWLRGPDLADVFVGREAS